MIKIYTKTGDRGTTSLFGGARVDKNSARIRAYGEVDELNSLIGVILAEDSFSWVLADKKKRKKIKDKQSFSANKNLAATYEIADQLFRIQNELFILGSDLATPIGVATKIPRIKSSHVKRLEREIDKWTRSLPSLRNFLIPGGGKIRSKLHLARTVARRTERLIVDLAAQEKINKYALAYINRLSDWFFTLARYINKLEGDVEIVWKGRSQK